MALVKGIWNLSPQAFPEYLAGIPVVPSPSGSSQDFENPPLPTSSMPLLEYLMFVVELWSIIAIL